MGVGALVEHQKAGVHPKVDDLPLGIGQAHVHGVRVAAKVIAGLQQGDVGVVVQTVCSGQAGNARTHNGHAGSRLRGGFARSGKRIYKRHNK